MSSSWALILNDEESLFAMTGIQNKQIAKELAHKMDGLTFLHEMLNGGIDNNEQEQCRCPHGANVIPLQRMNEYPETLYSNLDYEMYKALRYLKFLVENSASAEEINKARNNLYVVISRLQGGFPPSRDELGVDGFDVLELDRMLDKIQDNENFDLKSFEYMDGETYEPLSPYEPPPIEHLDLGIWIFVPVIEEVQVAGLSSFLPKVIFRGICVAGCTSTMIGEDVTDYSNKIRRLNELNQSLDKAYEDKLFFYGQTHISGIEIDEITFKEYYEHLKKKQIDLEKTIIKLELMFKTIKYGTCMCAVLPY